VARTLAFAAMVLLAAVLLAGSRRTPAKTSQPAPLPNVVVILADDMREDDLAYLPKTRALLGAEGTTFANSIVSTPLCCPSRATFLTGQYAHNHQVLANRAPLGGYGRLDASNTLPVWLQAAGYYTAHVGKYLNGYGTDVPARVPPGWSRWFGLTDPTTYRMYGYTVSDGGALVTYGNRPEDYQTDVLARKAEEVVRARAATGQPFFLTVAPVPPHLENDDAAGRGDPPRPAPRHLGRYAAEPLPRGPSFSETDVGDKPAHIRALRPLSKAQVARLTGLHRARLASMLAVDDLVERLVTALRQAGHLDRTVILFTSDNGFFMGEHRLPDGKFYPYEESVRVPLLVRGGGFPAGFTAEQPVSNIDLAPTIAALTRATPRRPVDGLPLLPLALDPEEGRDRALLIEGFGRSRPQVSYAAVRTDRWLYVEYATGDRELYDLHADPLQLRSRHDAPSLAGVRADLAARLAELRGCAGESCR
jgi:N-acetylglucosamine-6-sulfatase